MVLGAADAMALLAATSLAVASCRGAGLQSCIWHHQWITHCPCILINKTESLIGNQSSQKKRQQA